MFDRGSEIMLDPKHRRALDISFHFLVDDYLLHDDVLIDTKDQTQAVEGGIVEFLVALPSDIGVKMIVNKSEGTAVEFLYLGRGNEATIDTDYASICMIATASGYDIYEKKIARKT